MKEISRGDGDDDDGGNELYFINFTFNYRPRLLINASLN